MIGQLTEAGVFGKPHGIKGEIAASIDIDGIDIAADDFVFARIDGLDVPFRVEAVRYKGSGYLLTLKGLMTRRLHRASPADPCIWSATSMIAMVQTQTKCILKTLSALPLPTGVKR